MRKESTPNKELILQEGWRLFQQKGYRGVSTDELCERCSITKPTLYYYFQDKENLLCRSSQANYRSCIKAFRWRETSKSASAPFLRLC